MPQSEYQINIISSAIAGLFARSICHPIDTIKAKIQANDNFRNIYDVVKRTYHKEGLKGFYKGLSAVMVGGIPGVCLYMTSYEEAKNYLQKFTWISSHPFISYFISGILAEAVCCSIFTPVDVVKERLQVQSNQPIGFKYNGSLHALITIFKEEGLKGIYKGYNATIFSYGPFSALYFVIYEESKILLKSTYHKNTISVDLPFEQNLFCSSLAASIASFLTTPLDFAKLRYQIQRSNIINNTSQSTINNSRDIFIKDNELLYNGLSDTLFKLYHQYGIKGLYRGGIIRILFYTPSTGITMAIYEEFKKILIKNKYY